MKKLLILILALSLTLCACGDNTPDATSSVETPYPVNVRGIELLEKPERVVSLSPWLTACMVELGLSDYLIGVSDFCELDHVADMGIAEDPDIEAIVKAEPDFVLVSQPMSDEGREYLSKNNIPLYTIETPATFNELVGLFSDLITIFEGKTDGLLRGQALSASLIDRANAMKEILTEEETSVLYVQPDGFFATGDTLISDILSTIGLTNVAEEFTNYVIDEDALEELEPTLILVDKSVDLEEFIDTDPFDNMTENIVAVDMQKIAKLTPSALDELLVLVGGEEAITSSEPTSSEMTGSENTSSQE